MKMKRKGIKYTLVLLLNLLLLTPLNANAAQAWISSNGSEDRDTIYKKMNPGENDSRAEDYYQDYHVTVADGGKEYEAYCLDYGKNLDNKDNKSTVSCHSVANTKVAAGFSYIFNQKEDHQVIQMALREFARTKRLSKSQYYLYKSPLLAKVQSLVSAAQNASGTTQGGATLSFTKTGGSGAEVTYSVTSSAKLDTVKFTCKSGCEVVSQDWDQNNHGTITVRATNNGCSFTINAFYNGSGVYICESTKEDDQNVIYNNNSDASLVMPDGDVSSATPTQTFTGTIDASTGGDYYKTYCDRPDKCTEQTTVQGATFCDYNDNPEGSRNLSIVAPKNVKYCILNNDDDAGNSYKMDDGQINGENPYCAVYCKEDYTMTLPGARYTTSGRYFKLENTVVEDTRTCYATNADNDPEKGINIQKFITEVKEAQTDVIAKYNAYKKAQKELELSKNPTISETHCTPVSNNNGNYITGNQVNGKKLSISSGKFDGYAIKKCDSKTGVCEIEAKQLDTSAISWGSEVIEDSHGDGTRSCQVQNYEHDFEGVVTSARNALQEAINNLNDKIQYMEECYNWVNRLCLNPEVKFDYEEQYSTQINYTRIGGSETIEGTDAKYHDGETIGNEYNAEQSASLENPPYAICSLDNCKNTPTEKGISTLVKHLYYRKIEAVGSAEYQNTQEFESNYPHGTIDSVPEGSDVRENYEYLGAVFPVALKRDTGVYQWTLNFSNLGMYNVAGCMNGRLDDVLAVIQKDASAELEYVCVYVIDCDDCEYECVGEGCLIPDCPECDVYCENCIFDGLTTIEYKVKSLNNMNPNNDLGPNWTTDKGQETLKAIEQKGEGAYQEPEYYFKLTPNNMKEIRDYNKNHANYSLDDVTYSTSNGIENAENHSSFLRSDKNQKLYFSSVKLNDKWSFYESAKVGAKEVVDPSVVVGPAWK